MFALEVNTCIRVIATQIVQVISETVALLSNVRRFSAKRLIVILVLLIITPVQNVMGDIKFT